MGIGSIMANFLPQGCTQGKMSPPLIGGIEPHRAVLSRHNSFNPGGLLLHLDGMPLLYRNIRKVNWGNRGCLVFYIFGKLTIQRIATEWTWGSVPPIYSPFVIELESDQRWALASNLINWWTSQPFSLKASEKRKRVRVNKDWAILCSIHLHVRYNIRAHRTLGSSSRRPQSF